MQQPPQASQPAPQPGAVWTDAELRALLSHRAELKSLLESVLDRRAELSQQTPANAAVARDFQARLRELDERSARLDKDIGRVDDAIADAIARGVATTTSQATQTSTQVPGGGPLPGEAPNVRIVVGLGLAFLIASVFVWRYAWSRAAKRFARPASDQAGRFEQLQQSVDVIALEVERISESQRYLTKVLNESLHPALGAGEARPIQQAHKGAAPVPARSETG